jgi:hypothetical protein
MFKPRSCKHKMCRMSSNYRTALDAISQLLREHKVVDGKQVKALIVRSPRTAG